LYRIRDSDHAPFRDGLSSVGSDLQCSTHIQNLVSTIICNEDMKGNAKCKNSRFEPPFGGLRGNAQGPFDEKRIVHFLLVITELFSQALTALIIKQNLSKSEFS